MRHVRSTASAEARALRARADALDDAIDREASGFRPIAAARRLVQVYDGGSLPTAANRVYLTRPVELDGGEVEGGSATPDVDGSTSIPVVVLHNAAVAGDLLPATAVGGRWVAEKGKPKSSGYPCGTCTIPMSDLTVSWNNAIWGPGSTPLIYQPSPGTSWKSACSQELLYQLSCNQGQVEFRVTYFLSGSCPTGQSQYASNLRNNPYRLTVSSLVCGSSFLMTLAVSSSGSPNLWASGYTSFTISK